MTGAGPAPARTPSATELDLLRAAIRAAGCGRVTTLAGYATHPGPEYLLILAEGAGAKLRLLGGEFRDAADGGLVFFDLLWSETRGAAELWLWKPEPGAQDIAVPALATIRFENRPA